MRRGRALRRRYGHTRRLGGLARVILPSGNEAVYTDARETAQDTMRYGVHVATKMHGEWYEKPFGNWQRAHESDARAYDRARLIP